MKKNIVEEAINYYNNRDINGMAKCWHEEITTYDLKTNKIFANGKETIKKATLKYMDDSESQVIIQSTIEVGNIIIIKRRNEKNEILGVSICEIENNLIKRVWYLFE